MYTNAKIQIMTQPCLYSVHFVTSVKYMQDKLTQLINGSKDYKYHFDKDLASFLNFNIIEDRNENIPNDSAISLSQNDDIEEIGIDTQLLSQISDFREDISHKCSNTKVLSTLNDKPYQKIQNGSEITETMYQRLLPTFNEIASNMKNEDDFNTTLESMKKSSFNLIKDRMKDRKIKENETTFIGEQNGSMRPE